MRLLIDDADDQLEGRPLRVSSPDTDSRFLETVMSAATAARGFVANVLADPDHFDGCGADVQPDDLRDDFARTVFTEARSLYQAVQAIPLDRLAERLKATRKYDSFHRLSLDLVELFESGGAGTNAEYFLNAVRKTGRQIDVYHASQESLRDVMSIDTDATELDDIDAIAQSALDRNMVRESSNDIISISEAADLALQAIDRRHDPRAPKMPRIGFPSVDRIVTPFDPGDLIIIAARASVGKTAFAASVALNAVMEHRPTLFFSLEMGRAAIGERVSVVLTGAHGGRLRSGKATDADLVQVSRARGLTHRMPLYLNDTRTIRVSQIAAACRRTKRRYGLELVVIDYLQIITSAERKAPRWEQVAQISRDLKIMAGDLGVPVIGLAQLNREVENRPDPRPRLSDLREAGNIEQDADTVLMLYRHAGQSMEQEIIRVGVIVSKQRNGALGETELEYVRPQIRFREPIEHQL